MLPFWEVSKKAVLSAGDKTAQTVGCYCLLLHAVDSASVSRKRPYDYLLFYTITHKKSSAFSLKNQSRKNYFLKNQRVPSTVISKVPGVTVTTPVSVFSVTVAAGTVIS